MPLGISAVDTIAQLRTKHGVARGVHGVVHGHSAVGDRGGGTFRWELDTTSSDDGGTVIVPSGARVGAWKRVFNGDVHAPWFGATGDGSTDDTTALEKSFAAAARLKAVLFIPTGTYNVSRELTISTSGMRIRGDGQSGGIVGGIDRTILTCTNPAQRSILNFANDEARVESIMLDCANNAKYGVRCELTSQSVFRDMLVTRSVLDGYYIDFQRDLGGGAFNDFLTLQECSAYLCGSVFVSAGLASDYGGGIPLHPVTATGTVAINAYSPVITGTGTNFLAAGARPGDWIRVGTAPNTYALEIETIDSDTQITAYGSSYPTVSLSGQPYAIGVGDGYHEMPGSDNSRALIIGGLWRGIGGSGIRSGISLYGPTIIKPQLDTCGIFGIVIGTNGYTTGITSSILSPYFEGQSGSFACIGSINAAGLTIDQPVWDGAARKLFTQYTTYRNVGQSGDSDTRRQWGGKNHLQDLNYVEHQATGFDALGMREYESKFSYYTAIGPSPASAKVFAIPADDHAGSVDVDVVGSYEDSGTKRGRRKVSVGYVMVSGTVTFGTVDDLTPTNQINASVPAPTVTYSAPNLSINVLAQTSGAGGGGIYYQGSVTIRVAAKA